MTCKTVGSSALFLPPPPLTFTDPPVPLRVCSVASEQEMVPNSTWVSSFLDVLYSTVIQRIKSKLVLFDKTIKTKNLSLFCLEDKVKRPLWFRVQFLLRTREK